jgi:shikimate kinase
MTKLIILRGYPGAGKSTIGKALQVRGAGKFIDHNAILTFVANIAGDDSGIYDEIASLELSIARKLLKAGVSPISARGFSSLESIKPYEALAAEAGAEIRIIRIDVNYEELAKRVQGPERTDRLSQTTNPELLEKWISENPLIDHPEETVIDNTRSIGEVVSDVLLRVN